MLYAAASGETPWLRWLVQQGVDVNQQDPAGNTPLHAAAHMGQPGCVQFLLRSKQIAPSGTKRKGLTAGFSEQ